MKGLGPLALAAVTAGCIAAPSPTASIRSYPDLSIQNGTTIAVTLVVNSMTLETVGPGVLQDPVPQRMPSLPWRVEARSPSGRLLTSLTITPSTYIDANTGAGARVDLSCGRLDLWSGPPMLGPVPGSGSPGDCS
jgi:hypothetical protein